MPDPRKPRGLRHSLPAILAIAACAVIAGARSFVAIAEWAAAVTPAGLAKLGVTGEVPCESTFRRTINKMDANGLDLILGGWGGAARRESEGNAGDRGGREILARLGHRRGAVPAPARRVHAYQWNRPRTTRRRTEDERDPHVLNTSGQLELLGVLVTADALHSVRHEVAPHEWLRVKGVVVLTSTA